MNKSTLRAVVMPAASADETLGRIVDLRAYQNAVFYVKGTGTTSSGVITIEEADWDPDTELDYTGAWSSLTTVNASGVSGGGQQAIHLTPSAYGFVRARISTVIGGGGTISVVLRAS